MQIGEYSLNCYEELAAEEALEIELKKLSKKEFINKYMQDKRNNKENE